MQALIYKITNPNGKVYVGSTINLKDRIYRYKTNRVKHQIKISRSIEKYGWDKHFLEVIFTCDVSERYFYENKLGKELIDKRKLEDKEREITLKLEDVEFNIDKVKGSLKMIGESEVLTTALSNLEKRQANLSTELSAVKELQYKERIKG